MQASILAVSKDCIVRTTSTKHDNEQLCNTCPPSFGAAGQQCHLLTMGRIFIVSQFDQGEENLGHVSVPPDFMRAAEDSGDAAGEGGVAAWGGCGS